VYCHEPGELDGTGTYSSEPPFLHGGRQSRRKNILKGLGRGTSTRRKTHGVLLARDNKGKDA